MSEAYSNRSCFIINSSVRPYSVTPQHPRFPPCLHVCLLSTAASGASIPPVPRPLTAGMSRSSGRATAPCSGRCCSRTRRLGPRWCWQWQRCSCRQLAAPAAKPRQARWCGGGTLLPAALSWPAASHRPPPAPLSHELLPAGSILPQVVIALPEAAAAYKCHTWLHHCAAAA